MDVNITELKTSIRDAVEADSKPLWELSQKIHDCPELGFKEVNAAKWLSEYLADKGFTVERGICQIDTSFRATYGKGKPVIAYLAEYDALPDLGHACGHNIIAGCAVGAAAAARLAVDRFGGSVQVIGTPAEELYGGKILMAERGAFADVDAAMIVHPGTSDMATTQALACQTLDIEFFGKAAHAAAQPEQGINALEAMLLSFAGINSLRQHIRDDARIHGIITDGGKAANIVPEHCAGNFIVRAMKNDYLDELKNKVLNCFTGAAAATGARLEFKWGERYDSLKNNHILANLYLENAKSIGRIISLDDPERAFGSTDMGNVSQVTPSIHPFVSISSANISFHSKEFAVAASSEAGKRGMLDAAAALAMSGADLLAGPELTAKIRQEFQDTK